LNVAWHHEFPTHELALAIIFSPPLSLFREKATAISIAKNFRGAVTSSPYFKNYQKEKGYSF
jgi:hypothetical protein